MRSILLSSFLVALAGCKCSSYQVSIDSVGEFSPKQPAIGIWVVLCDEDYPAPNESFKTPADIAKWFADDDAKRKSLEQVARAGWVNLKVNPRATEPASVELVKPKDAKKPQIFVVANFANSSSPDSQYVLIDPAAAKKCKVDVVLTPGKLDLKPSEK